MNDIDEFLSHFGTKGMKWGVRKEDSASKFSFKSLSPEQKKTLKKVAIGAAVVAAAGIAVYGGVQYQNYKVEKSSLANARGGLLTFINKNYGKDSGEVFEAGHTFYRQSQVQETAMRGRAYVMSKASEAEAYKVLGGNQIKISALDKIVTPSTKERVDILAQSITKKDLQALAKTKRSVGAKIAVLNADKTQLAKLKLNDIAMSKYDTPDGQAFIQSLISKGFSAVKDDHSPGSSAHVIFDSAKYIYN